MREAGRQVKPFQGPKLSNWCAKIGGVPFSPPTSYRTTCYHLMAAASAMRIAGSRSQSSGFCSFCDRFVQALPHAAMHHTLQTAAPKP